MSKGATGGRVARTAKRTATRAAERTAPQGAASKSTQRAAGRAGADTKRRKAVPRASLLDAAAALIQRALRLDMPADRVLAQAFGEQRAWGSRERALLADVLYRVMRRWHALRHQGRAIADGPADADRRLALLAWPDDALEHLDLDDATRDWLARAHAVPLPEGLRHHLPTWLADRLRTRLGDAELAALAEGLLQPAPLDLRVNALRARPADVQRALAEAGVTAVPTPFAPLGLRVQGHASLGRLAVMTQGLAEVQDEGSQLLALLVDARRGDMVADFCAGGGGKTLALGAAMRATGRLYAMDTSAARLAALAPRAKRAGLNDVYTMTLSSEQDERLERLAGKLDRVLVDAPCSGLGTLRRCPELKWRVGADDIPAWTDAQRRILQASARLVKPGGRLVYATCSLLDEENEAVVNAFLATRRDFITLNAAEVLSGVKVQRADALVAGDFLRLWPHRHGTDGFFAAVLKRQG